MYLGPIWRLYVVQNPTLCWECWSSDFSGLFSAWDNTDQVLDTALAALWWPSLVKIHQLLIWTFLFTLVFAKTWLPLQAAEQLCPVCMNLTKHMDELFESLCAMTPYCVSYFCRDYRCIFLLLQTELFSHLFSYVNGCRTYLSFPGTVFRDEEGFWEGTGQTGQRLLS